MSDGQRAYRGGKAGNDDISATNDPDGTIINTGAGNDILRGRGFNDILTGGSGYDQMFGGGGADQFRFFGNQIEGTGDIDDVYDLDFSEGDTLVFGTFGSGTFSDADGVNAFNGGADASISSWEGVINAVNGSANVTAYRERPSNDNLVLEVTDSDGQVQQVVISGGWTQYLANGGTEGVPGGSV